MTDKTAIDALTACAELERLVIAIEQYEEYTDGQPALGTCKSLVEIKKASRKAREALSAIEAEKPVEDAEEVAISIANLFSAYTLRNGKHLPASVEAAQLLMHFAESYHAKQCQICQRNELPDFARFENRSSGTTDVDK
jgi:DNA-binding XRE family transcriptional regulator